MSAHHQEFFAEIESVIKSCNGRPVRLSRGRTEYILEIKSEGDLHGFIEITLPRLIGYSDPVAACSLPYEYDGCYDARLCAEILEGVRLAQDRGAQKGVKQHMRWRINAEDKNWLERYTS